MAKSDRESEKEQSDKEDGQKDATTPKEKKRRDILYGKGGMCSSRIKKKCQF